MAAARKAVRAVFRKLFGQSDKSGQANTKAPLPTQESVALAAALKRKSDREQGFERIIAVDLETMLRIKDR